MLPVLGDLYPPDQFSGRCSGGPKIALEQPRMIVLRPVFGRLATRRSRAISRQAQRWSEDGLRTAQDDGSEALFGRPAEMGASRAIYRLHLQDDLPAYPSPVPRYSCLEAPEVYELELEVY